jgi:hypothetical protein
MVWMLVAVFMFLAAPSVAQPAPPHAPQGFEFQRLRTSREHLRAGEEVLVSGDGCAGGGEVRFELYDPHLQSSTFAVAENDGTFVQLVHVPTTAQAGRAWLRASCRTLESGQKVLQAPLAIARPAFVVTWTNVLFGLGTSLVAGGFLLALVRRGHGRGRRSRHAKTYRSRGRRRLGGYSST